MSHIHPNTDTNVNPNKHANTNVNPIKYPNTNKSNNSIYFNR
jgi:hypothetical protein